MHGLDVAVVGQRVLSELASDAGLLEAAEGDLRVERVVAVDPDGAGLELVPNGEGTRNVALIFFSAELVDRSKEGRTENTAAAKPYSVSLACAITSFSSLKREMTTTGPKTSSLTMRMCGLTSVKMVGWMK